MIDTQKKFNNAFDAWSTKLDYVELSDDSTRAILTIPLFHVGPNKKGLFWTEEMLKEVVPLYQNAAFRYDLDGVEGSSHTIKKLSSPHFDVGWTYDGSDGAWYDEKTKSLWVKGEVTHPQVIEKLKRTTSDGKREVNFASMGIIVDEAKCSICGSNYVDICENGHERNNKYEMKTCYKIPTKCSKGLHVALTNDPADAEAVIANCVFQDLGEERMKNDYKPSNQNLQSSNGLDNEEEQMAPNTNMRDQSSKQISSTDKTQLPGGLAQGNDISAQPGSVPSPEIILRDLAERIKTLENQINSTQMETGTPELVNSAPQDQMTQSNMGTTTQFENQKEEKPMANDNMAVSKGQATNEKVPVNPKETADEMSMDPMGQIMEMLQQILAKMNMGAETQDVSELENVKKDKIVHDETKPMDHQEPGDQVSSEASTDEGNKKNKQHMNEPGKVATADNSELAELKSQVQKLSKKLELQSMDVPEFGGSQSIPAGLDVADMGAEGRRSNFGAYGAWDAIYNGAESAKKFKR